MTPRNSEQLTVDENLRQKFELAWQESGWAEITEFLPSQDDPRFLGTLEELVHLELEFRWAHPSEKPGDVPALVEDYLKRFPGLRQGLIVRRLACQEFLVRQQHGDKPSKEEYLRRFADCGLDEATLEESLEEQRAGAIPLPQIPGYEILGVLGRGGMGIVFKARQVSLNRQVAIKMLPAGHATPEDLARFRSEAAIIARLQHPHVVQIHEVGSWENRPYFTLELLLGGSLAGKLKGKPQLPLEAARMTATLAHTLAAVHAQGILHRDLKPGNVLLTADGTPKITDFGLAKQESVESAAHTRTGAIMGTPSYMAPEQAIGAQKDLGPATDIYALGAILYEMLTGRPPFQAATAFDTLSQVVALDPVPPSRLQPTLPRDAETICLKCLEKEPVKRYPTAGTLADDLDRFLVGKPIQARPVGRGERLWKWARRNRKLAAVSGLAIVAVFATLVTLVVANLLILSSRNEAIQAQGVAEERRRQAEENFRMAREAVDKYFTRVAEDPRLKEHFLEGLRRDLLEMARDFYERFVQQEGGPEIEAERNRAYSRLALISNALGAKTDAVNLFLKSCAGFEVLLAAEPNSLTYRWELAYERGNLGRVYHDLGRHKDAIAVLELAVPAFQQLAQDDATRQASCRQGLVNCFSLLAMSHRAEGHLGQAESAYKEGILIGEQLVKELPGSPGPLNSLSGLQAEYGEMCIRLNRLEEGERLLTAAAAGIRQLADTNPGQGFYQNNLAAVLHQVGVLHYQTGRAKKAEEFLKQSLTIREQLRRLHPDLPDYGNELASVCTTLLAVYANEGRLPEAETLANKALDIHRGLVKQFPNVPEYQTLLAETLSKLGFLLKRAGQLAEAEGPAQEAVKVLLALVQKHPGIPRYQSDLADCYYELGGLFNSAGKYSEGMKALQEGLHLYEGLARQYPQDPGHQKGTGRMHRRLVALHQKFEQPDRARESAAAAAAVYGGLVKQYPNQGEFIFKQADALTFVAVNSKAPSQKSEAVAAAKSAWEIFKTLPRRYPAYTPIQDQLTCDKVFLGDVFFRVDLFGEAEACYQEALQGYDRMARTGLLDPSDAINIAHTHFSLGEVNCRQGKEEPGLSCFNRAIVQLESGLRRWPKNASLGKDLAAAYFRRWQLNFQLKHYVEAAADLERAAKLDDKTFGKLAAEKLPAVLALIPTETKALVASGKHEVAAKAGKHLEETAQERGLILFHAALRFALAAELLDKEASLPPDQRSLARAHYGDQALTLLRKAQTAGFFKDPAQVRLLVEEKHFAILEAREDFRRLLLDLKQPPSNPSQPKVPR